MMMKLKNIRSFGKEIKMYSSTTIVGNLTKDPEMRYTPSGTAVTKFTVAVNRGKDKEGNDMGADFYRVVAWGNLAEICGQYLKKGKQVLVEGRIRIEPYEKDGVEKLGIELKCRDMKMLGGKKDEKS